MCLFASAIGIELMPWQRWFLIHALELNEDGGFRYRTVLLIVARQNGKTTIAKVLALWFMLNVQAAVVLGTSTTLEYAREAFMQTVATAEEHDEDHPKDRWIWRGQGRGGYGVKQGALDTSMRFKNGSRYKVASATRTGGRSLSVDLGLADELREHDSYDAWNAMTGATTARPNAIVVGLSNAGEDHSVVLNGLREVALSNADPTIGIFEWSGPEGCDLDDPHALAQANPALGRTITLATLQSKRRTMTPGGFRTEHLCQRVSNIDAAVDQQAWLDCADSSGSLESLKARVAVTIDVSPDGEHVTLCAASVTPDGKVRGEVVEAWETTAQAAAELDDLLTRIKPRRKGYFENGPAAALKPVLAKHGFEQIKDASAACMGLAEQVGSRQVLHNGDGLLTAQVTGAGKIPYGDGWRFSRRGGAHVDAAYALAGAVHLARMMPAPVGRPRIILPRS